MDLDQVDLRRLRHVDLQARLRAHREQIAPRLRDDWDALMARIGYLTDDVHAFFHPLAQPLVAFPCWVASAMVLDGDDELVGDMVESTVMGYLYVRVHDDLLDEGIGDPGRAMLLADAFLVRHVGLLARHVGSATFWDLHGSVAARYSDAMLLEREVNDVTSDYGLADFDRVLDRSQPLVLAGAALAELAGRSEDIVELGAFVFHVVRAGQVVDDLVDCERDVAAGNYTWVARQLGALDGAEHMARRLLTGGLEQLTQMIESDLDAAVAAARRCGLEVAVAWVEARRADVDALRRAIIRSALLG